MQPDLLRTLVADGYIPVLATVAADTAGQALNVNADIAAGEVRSLLLLAAATQLAWLRNCSILQPSSQPRRLTGSGEKRDTCPQSGGENGLLVKYRNQSHPSQDRHVAVQVAAALKAEKLILMTDVPGVMRDKDDVSTKFAELDIKDTRQLVADGVIAGGMIPKVRHACNCQVGHLEVFMKPH